MRFNDEDKQQFERDGYLIARGLFAGDEMEQLIRVTKGDASHVNDVGASQDASGTKSKLRLRNFLEDDISSAFVASQRVVDNAEFLLGDEVYHFHHKMMLKEPRVGGAWEWHQDYGYWYKSNHCLYPDMLSCAIAVDACTRENGCMQLLRGSHMCGRIEHMKVGTQTGADPERVELLKERLELVYATMEPGDALFFHSNTAWRASMHFSDIRANRDPTLARTWEGGYPMTARNCLEKLKASAYPVAAAASPTRKPSSRMSPTAWRQRCRIAYRRGLRPVSSLKCWEKLLRLIPAMRASSERGSRRPGSRSMNAQTC